MTEAEAKRRDQDDYDGAVRTCEKEKFAIAKEVQILKEEMAFLSEVMPLQWRESLEVFNNAEKDLLVNLEQSADLKSMYSELQKDLAALGTQAALLKKSILAGTESRLSGERKTVQLNEAYTEKQKVISKVEATLKTNQNQRTLILGAVKNVIISLMKKLYSEKIKYCDLKFNMCSFLQEYHKLKKKHHETEAALKMLSETTPRNTNNTVDTAGRTLKDLLTDIDSLAQKKLSSLGLKPSIGFDLAKEQPKSNLLSNSTPPVNSLLPQGSQSPGPTATNNGMKTPTKKTGKEDNCQMSIFKDRSLDVSRTSRLSAKSNVSKRYQQNDDDEDDESSISEDEQMPETRSINKYSYYDKSRRQHKSTISTPDRSLTRGISPIGEKKDGNSYFLSPER